MAEAAVKQSESMEDILQSIKRIIEDDSAADSKGVDSKGAEVAAPAAPQPLPADVLELTETIQEDGSVATLPPLPAPVAAKTETPKAEAPKVPEPVAATPVPTMKPAPKPSPMEEGLVSDQAARAAVAALRPIVDSGHRDYSIPHIPSSTLRNGNTVEDLILEALKPMLKAWLDEHLPLIVQKIVEKEVKRIVTFHNG